MITAKTVTFFVNCWMATVLLAPLNNLLSAVEGKPVLLYSRYFNAQGENRYTAEGTFKDILKILEDKFVVRVNAEPLNAQSLQGVAVVLIANPSDKAVGTNPPPPHCSAEDVVSLVNYVEGGGGLIVMGNQENHNYETKEMNKLLVKFGMEFVEHYTDAKQLIIPESAPIIGGKKWAYYTGNQIVLHAGHQANPQSIVVNDLAQKALGGPRDEAGVLMSMATPGKGHVVLVTDSGWVISNALNGKGIGKVAITEHDNAEICTRICRWAAGKP